MDHEKMVNKAVRELEKQGAEKISVCYDNFPGTNTQKITIVFEMKENNTKNG